MLKRILKCLFRKQKNTRSDKVIEEFWEHHSKELRIDIDWESINYNRIFAVNYTLSRLSHSNPAYLEIGTFKNELFNSVIATDKIGVDPSSGGTHKMTSDEFFKTNTKMFDVIFIDGLHTYEQVTRDINHAYQFLKKNGFILLHDMIPVDALEASPIRLSLSWTGDVWKCGFDLYKQFKDDFFIINIDHGVGVIYKKEDDNVVIPMNEIMNQKGFDYFYDHRDELPIYEIKKAIEWINKRTSLKDKL